MKKFLKTLLKVFAVIVILLVGAMLWLLEVYPTRGPVVLIKTDQPAEDFVVVCQWHKDPLISMDSGRMLSDEKVFVVKSDEKVDCGYSITGGYASALVLHPVYWYVDITERDGIKTYHFTGTQLDRLDELRKKFEAGYWDGFKNPGFQYAVEVGIACGFSRTYLEYYREARGSINIAEFKNKYDAFMLSCIERVVSVLRKYRYPDIKDARYRLDKFWIILSEEEEK